MLAIDVVIIRDFVALTDDGVTAMTAETNRFLAATIDAHAFKSYRTHVADIAELAVAIFAVVFHHYSFLPLISIRETESLLVAFGTFRVLQAWKGH